MEDTHKQQLEEIDRQQREQEKNNASEQSDAFAAAITDALSVDKKNLETPLLDQEDLEEEEPQRVNLTAVICTAIVAVCATIILCVAQPWRDNAAENDTVVAEEIEQPETLVNTEQQAQAQKPLEVTKTEPAKEVKKDTVTTKKDQSTLPVLRATNTGTDNPYNAIRLIDISSRVLTDAEVAQMSKEEMALARNAAYARHGYQFNNAEFREYFAKQSWFKPTDVSLNTVPLSKTELDNINKIKALEAKK